MCIQVTWRAYSLKHRLLGPARVSAYTVGLGQACDYAFLPHKFPSAADGAAPDSCF